MDENLELLTHVYETSQMGSYTITTLINKLKNKENKIKFTLEKELKEYEKYIKISEKILNKYNINPPGTSVMSKIGSNIGIMKETIMDNSDSAMAQMLIEGLTMGITLISAKINSYKKNADRKVLKIAKDFVKFQENEVERLKVYM